LRLTEEEHAKLFELGSSLARGGSLSAICAYGSKVAGYSRPDSDYDIIVVARRFREGVRYKYVEEPVQASALIVDEQLLKDDARTSYLGEFVVGRLLNIYEQIVNGEMIRGAEVEYKRRVIAEALMELSADFGDFSRHLQIPYDYFLFDKLNRRSALYPPAHYSYVKTYTCPLGRENRAASVAGFSEAAGMLESMGLVRKGPSGVAVVHEKLKGDAFTKVQSMFSLATRGVTQYAVHGYAGRVGLSVVSREAQSKLKRMREAPPRFEDLERPRSLLMVEEGRLIPDSSLLERTLADILGFSSYTTSERYLGDPYSTTRVLTFRDSGKEVAVVVKNYSDVRSLKWALLGIWASAANRFSMSPSARLEREYRMSAVLRRAGALVPGILAVAPEERLVVKEFVEGPTLASVVDGVLKGFDAGLDDVAGFANLMAMVHDSGVALGDAKASNVIVSPRGLYLTDLEQAMEAGDRAWDVAEFLYYSAKLSVREEAMGRVARRFLSEYSRGSKRQEVSKAREPKYFRPFQPFLTPGMAKTVRDAMSEFA
jgi:tRNA A-37 threonylcarbamoyl transferase component Bud32/predicted nucleotidyltransferase